jgi:predicted RNA-binding Zn-ribbon protein involved in translation (DUF1610 family)
MDRTAFAQQVHVAMVYASRKLRSAGMPASIMQICIVVAFLVLLQSDSKYILWFMVIALPVSLAISAVLALAVRNAFKRHAPSCPACAKPIGLLTRRKAMATGLCPNCGSALFGPNRSFEADGYAAAQLKR